MSRSHLAPARFILQLSSFILLLTLARPAAAQPQVADLFRDYYAAHDGMRVLGPPISDVVGVNGYPAQYFEKGRIEDHRADVHDPAWQFMYGRLTAELIEGGPGVPVSETSLIYGELERANLPESRTPPPAGFPGGTAEVSWNSWPARFIPYDPQLRPAPGYLVPRYFWEYMNRRDLFPGGWLHDLGLPMTPLLTATAVKGAEQRIVQLQAFERTVLTYDVKNPPAWMVERANLGRDVLEHLSVLPANLVELPRENAPVTLPLHILAYPEQPGSTVTATLRWPDGMTVSERFTALAGPHGRATVIGNLAWPPSRRDGELPPTQPVTLELSDASGVWARVPLLLLNPNDGDGGYRTRVVAPYFVLPDGAVSDLPTLRVIPATEDLPAAAIHELLWGPVARDGPYAGLTTAIPTPAEVLAAPNRQPTWGNRVTLRSLVVENGVATADFSPELLAYGGGSARALAIREQITRTLTNFSEIQAVRIIVAGRADALEP